MSNPCVLVTGASGFIGGKLARRLVEEGADTLCLYRRKSPPHALTVLEEQKAKLIRMDISPEIRMGQANKLGSNCNVDLLPVLEGVDTVYHLASLASDWGQRQVFERINVQGTMNLLDAAEAAGIRRFVYISSLAVHGFGPHRNSTEEGPYYPPTHVYQSTKKKAEELAIARNRPGFEVCVIRPGNVYGPDDTTTLFPIFEAIEKGIMGTVNKGRALTSPVYIDDLVNVILAAGTSSAMPGQTVNITSGEDITWRQFVDLAARALSVKPPRLDLPAWLALPSAHAMNTLWRAFAAKNAPPLTPYRIMQASQNYHFDISKARRLLGYDPKTFCAAGLPLAAESWFEWKKS